LAEKVVQDKWG